MNSVELGWRSIRREVFSAITLHALVSSGNWSLRDIPETAVFLADALVEELDGASEAEQ